MFLLINHSTSLRREHNSSWHFRHFVTQEHGVKSNLHRCHRRRNLPILIWHKETRKLDMKAWPLSALLIKAMLNVDIESVLVLPRDIATRGRICFSKHLLLIASQGFSSRKTFNYSSFALPRTLSSAMPSPAIVARIRLLVSAPRPVSTFLVVGDVGGTRSTRPEAVSRCRHTFILLWLLNVLTEYVSFQFGSFDNYFHWKWRQFHDNYIFL